MVRKKKKSPESFDDPFSSHEEIMGQFFSPSDDSAVKPPEPEAEVETPTLIPAPAEETKAAATEPALAPPPEPALVESKSEPAEPGFNPELEKYLDDFLLEFSDHIESLDSALLALEKEPGDTEQVNTCFRQYHNLKGMSNALGFSALGELCHEVESTLSIFRGNRQQLPGGLIDTLFDFTDLLRLYKTEIETSHSDRCIDAADLIKQVQTARHEPEDSPTPSAVKESAESASRATHMAVFLQELGENIESIDQSLLALEKEAANLEEVNSVFRLIHNIKGISNSLGLERLKNLSHCVESALSDYRTEGVLIPGEMVDAFFEYNDLLRAFMHNLEESGDEGDIDVVSLADKINSLRGQTSAQEEKTEQKAPEMDEERMEMLRNYMPDFLLEYGEHIESLDTAMLKLEKKPDDFDEINSCFRQIHNLKGMSNALGFFTLGNLCHAAESALMLYREEKKPLPRELLDISFEMNDMLRVFKQNLESTNSEGDVDTRFIVARLAAIKTDVPVEPPPPSDTAAAKPATSSAPASSTTETKQKPAIVNPVTEKISTIRVNVRRLDDLMNSVGELVLLRNRNNQINHQLTTTGSTEELMQDFAGLAGQLDMVTGSLQAAVMRTRMLPVGNIFSKYNRVVRDLCRSLDKEAELVISGSETELDKNLIEDISDPLMHIIRNCLDHGLEQPDEREQAGKPRRGTVQLNAFQEGNSIIIEVADDGRGIDPEKVLAKCLEKGLVTEEMATMMSEADKLALIFLPGSSTAEKVSDVSGRGVGMDVVKTNVEKLRGQIEMESVIGSGTRMKIRIPLTLAIMQTLLCEVGAERYALPLFSIMETVRALPEEIERISGAPVIRLRDDILPVVYLSDLMGATNIAQQESDDDVEAAKIDIVVLKIGTKQVGLAVDKTLGQEEVLIKPLDVLKGIYEPKFISGATILGDGRIALILDVAEIIQVAKLLESETAEDIRKAAALEQEELVLLMSDGAVEQYGIELKGTGKIDIIESDQVEMVGGQELVRYHNEILPVTRMPYITGFDFPKYRGRLYVIIVAEDGQKAGLLVNELSGLKKLKRKELIKSTGSVDMEDALIVNNRVTIIVSISQVVRTANMKKEKRDYQQRDSEAIDTGPKQKHVLVVDDSKSQRAIINELLTNAGYRVTMADDGEEGISKLGGIDIVITDLEMPKLDGYEFTRAIKESYPALPVIMLTNYSGEENISQALEAGVDQFLVKQDSEGLLDTLARFKWLGA